jgi:hypothetical protein
MLPKGRFVVRQLDLTEEQMLRPEKCRACPPHEAFLAFGVELNSEILTV